jgi:CRP-like cAMP-binding protein
LVSAEREETLPQDNSPAGSPEEKLAEIAQAVQDKVYPARTIIFRQGDPGDSFYLITSGRVRVFRIDEDGIEIDLSELGPGESFGEMALLTGEPRSACVETLEVTRLRVLFKDEFNRIFNDNPQVAVGFIKKMSAWLQRDEIKLQEEAQRQFKAPPLSWVDFSVIIFVALICGVIFNLLNPNRISPFPPSWSDEPIRKVEVTEAAKAGEQVKAIFVDARPANFYEKERIKGSVNVPFAAFEIVYLMELGEEPKTREIIVYGKTISRLYRDNIHDEQVARKLILRGHKDVRVLEGGLSAWKAGGLPVGP